jgi:hypothetical protein
MSDNFVSKGDKGSFQGYKDANCVRMLGLVTVNVVGNIRLLTFALLSHFKIRNDSIIFLGILEDLRLSICSNHQRNVSKANMLALS